MSRRRRRGRWLVAALALVVAAALGAASWLLLVYPKERASGSGEAFVVEVPRGANARRVAGLLEERGVVESARVFGFYLRVIGVDQELRAGPVLLSGDLAPSEVARRLSRRSDRVPVRVTVPEGYTRFDIAARLEALGVCEAGPFLEATAEPPEGVDAPSAEGFLFPDTYDFRKGDRAARVAERMVTNGARRREALFAEHAERVAELEAELGWGTAEILTLASIVEKEAAVADERPRIAGVFLNRIRSATFLPQRTGGCPRGPDGPRERCGCLQADPTVSYGCLAEPERAPSCAAFDGRITRAMLEDPANRYSTYRHGGLPPGPIANPGLAAIEAVLTPDAHDYLYFVARGGGRHAFSAELEDHNAAVDRYILGEGDDEGDGDEGEGDATELDTTQPGATEHDGPDAP